MAMNGDYIDVDGVRTYFIDRGAGPTLVLIHGAAMAMDAHLTWFRTIDALADEYRLLAFDQIGFGRTDMPADGVYKNRLERVDHAHRFLQRLDVERACLIGHSEGGFMAMRLAVIDTARVAGVVVVTSGGTAPYLGGDADAQWIAAAEAAYSDPARLQSVDAFVRGNAHLSRVRDPVFDAMLADNFRRAIARGQDEMLRGEVDRAAYLRSQEEHLFPHLDTLDAPALLVWAGDDATVPVARGVKLLERIPGAELHIFRDAGHNVMHDRAGGFNRLLRGWCRDR